MLEIGQQLFAPRPEPIIDPLSLGVYVNKQIGYKIVDRSWIITILGGFGGALFLAGVMLRRAGK